MILDLAKAVQISCRREKDHGAVALILDLAKAVQISLGEGERKIMEQ